MEIEELATPFVLELEKNWLGISFQSPNSLGTSSTFRSSCGEGEL